MTSGPYERAPVLSGAAPRLPWWTWVAPALVAHAGTEISRFTTIAPGVSSIYLPIPFGLAMAYWWGPRVLPGLYLNAVLSAGLWDLPRWPLWPVYAFPEVLAVFLGWWLFEHVGNGRCWLPRLKDAVAFVLMAVLPAALVNGFLVGGGLVALGDLPATEFWLASWSGGIATMLDGLAVAAPLGMLLTPALERRGLSRTVGAAAATLRLPWLRSPAFAVEIAAAFAGILVLSRVVPLERYWSVYGVFAIWAAVRHGAVLAVVANLWIVLLTMFIPALTGTHALPTTDLQNLQTAMALTCLVCLIAGRTVSDQRDEMHRRKEAVRALSESEAFLRLSQRAGHVGSWEWDLRTDLIKWSDELARLHGLAPGEFDGSLAMVRTFCHPGDLERLGAAMARSRDGHDIGDFECRILPRGGGERVVLFAGEVQRDPDGRPARVAGVAIDITGRKRAEQALTQSEERLRLIIREQTEFIVKWLPDGTRTFVNDSYCRYFGVSEAQCIGTSFLPLVLPEHREMLRQKVAALTPEKPEATTEHVSFAGNGERRWQLWTDRGLFDAGGNLVELISTGRDVTERRQAEEALRELAARYRAILESSLDGLIVMNGAGEIVEFNAAAEALFGYAREDAIGQRLSTLIVPPELREAHEAGVRRFLETSEGRYIGKRVEMPARRSDGSALRVEVAINVISGTDPPLFAGAVRDISERLRLEEQLRQSQKMEAIGQLAGGVAHDFNNLLTIITGYTEQLREGLAADDPRAAMIEQIHQAGARSAGLTRQLLTFSRRQVLTLSLVDLNEVVRDMDRLLRRVVGENVSFTLRLQDKLHLVRADPGQLQQVLLNLALNARDVMPQGGHLTIETGDVELGEEYTRTHASITPGAHVQLTVSDSGFGMTKDVRERIFEPFFTTKETGKGTGLGLSVVHGIVTQGGGHINVYSEPGQGTTFRIYLPAVAPPSRTVPAPAAAQAPRGTETILLVEDEDAVRLLTSQMLRQCGYTVLEADSGEVAVRLARETDVIHLMVSDVVLPGMSGREVAERFKALHPGARLLFASGYTNDAVIRHGILHDQVAFLQKPFSLRTIAAKVREVLDT